MNKVKEQHIEQDAPEGEEDIVFLIKRMQKQLSFLEKKIDTLIERSKGGSGSSFRGKGFSKSYGNGSRQGHEGGFSRGRKSFGSSERKTYGNSARKSFGPSEHKTFGNSARKSFGQQGFAKKKRAYGGNQ